MRDKLIKLMKTQFNVGIMPSSFELRQASLNTQDTVCVIEEQNTCENPATNHRELTTT